MTGPHDAMPYETDPTEVLLRRALESSAAQVEVDPAALAKIRARTRRRAWWHRIRGGAMPLAFTSAATAVAATITSVVLTMGSCNPPSGEIPGASPTGGSAPSTGTPTESPPGSLSPSAGGTRPAPATALLPVYYLHDYRTKPMLYREFHRLTVSDTSKAARTKAAVTEMLDGRTAYDDDYISAWPASASVRNVSVSGSVVTVDLSGAAVNGDDPVGQAAALQQLIWTATAASDTDSMKLLLDGKAVERLWNQLPTGGTLRRGPAVNVVAPVWVIDPQEGAAVSGKNGVTINVAGIVFEATMHVRVRDSSGKLVFDRFLTLNAGPPSQGTGSVRTPALAPGRYTVQGFFFSPEDSSIQAVDDHSFTVS